MIYNFNKNLIGDRTQFFLRDSFDLITQKTNFLETSVKALYKCFLKLYNTIENKDIDINSKDNSYKTIIYYLTYFNNEIKYYSFMTEKIEFFKIYIDISCLFHNIYGCKSIIPQPPFKEQEFFNQLIDIENILVTIPGLFNFLLEWEKIEKLKEIHQYIL